MCVGPLASCQLDSHNPILPMSSGLLASLFLVSQRAEPERSKVRSTLHSRGSCSVQLRAAARGVNVDWLAWARPPVVAPVVRLTWKCSHCGSQNDDSKEVFTTAEHALTSQAFTKFGWSYCSMACLREHQRVLREAQRLPHVPK